MKALAVITALIFSLGVQAQTPVFQLESNGSITTNPSMIGPFYNDPGIKNLSPVLTSSTSVSIGARNFDVKAGYFEEEWYETERGKIGFTVIAIYSGSRKIFELRQPEIWTHVYDGETTRNYRKYTDNRYFIPITLSEQAVALAFLGWPYGGEMPYLTIIALTDNDAKLVFNQHMGINAITQSGSSYTMELQANIVEYDENGKLFDTPNNVPVIHHLEAKNGLLYFK